MINNYMNLFITQLPGDTKYYSWYSAICQRAITRNLPNTVYTEKHHILPKSLYPEYSKNKDNIVRLTGREHFICHWLLTKIINDTKIIYAFQMMLPNKTGKRYLPKSATVYENLKRIFNQNNKGAAGLSWYTNGTINKFVSEVPSDGYYQGRTFSAEHKGKLKGIPKTDDQKLKQSKSMLGKPGMSGDDNPSKRREVRDKISKAKIGSKASIETRLKMRDSKLGKKRGPYKSRSSP